MADAEQVNALLVRKGRSIDSIQRKEMLEEFRAACEAMLHEDLPFVLRKLRDMLESEDEGVVLRAIDIYMSRTIPKVAVRVLENSTGGDVDTNVRRNLKDALDDVIRKAETK